MAMLGFARMYPEMCNYIINDNLYLKGGNIGKTSPFKNKPSVFGG